MLSILLSGGNFITALIFILSGIFVTFCVLPFHEFAHAWAAYKLGDNTAKWQGRLSLNPMRHIDWAGAAMIILVGFGWAKPVPVNSLRFKNPKSDMALTALAGPVANIIMGFVSLVFYNLVLFIGVKSGLFVVSGESFRYLSSAGATALMYLSTFFYYVANINFGLAVFNLIPIPPLDGSKILAVVLPDRLYVKFMMYERYFYFLLLILLFSRVLSVPLDFLRDGLFNGLDGALKLLFGL